MSIHRPWSLGTPGERALRGRVSGREEHNQVTITPAIGRTFHLPKLKL